jgi:predicted metalloprotease with PDZ domain
MNCVGWDSLAFKAGLAVDHTIVGVNGKTFKVERLKAAITANKSGKEPIELLVKKGESLRTVKFDYAGGLRYPRLERIPGTPDRLNALLQPMK